MEIVSRTPNSNACSSFVKNTLTFFGTISCRMISPTLRPLLAINEGATARNPAASRNTANAIKLVPFLSCHVYIYLKLSIFALWADRVFSRLFQGGVGCSINCRCEGCKNAFGRKDGECTFESISSFTYLLSSRLICFRSAKSCYIRLYCIGDGARIRRRGRRKRRH